VKTYPARKLYFTVSKTVFLSNYLIHYREKPGGGREKSTSGQAYAGQRISLVFAQEPFAARAGGPAAKPAAGTLVWLRLDGGAAPSLCGGGGKPFLSPGSWAQQKRLFHAKEPFL
jgi:hypothetical protein